MKSRRVFILLELQTDEPLEVLAKQWTWKQLITTYGSLLDGSTKVLQVMANVSQDLTEEG